MSSRERTLSDVLRAAADVRRQVAYYRTRAPGLEVRFMDSPNGAERSVLSNPTGFALIDEHTEIRAILLRRFPFRLMYAVRDDNILVVAVAHPAREPDRLVHRPQ